jgi:hypothetical protein
VAFHTVFPVSSIGRARAVSSDGLRYAPGLLPGGRAQLGVMLSGMSKAGTRLHVRATSMVATGAVSAFRILSVHARVRTLQGCATDAAGQVVPADGL